MLTVKTLAIACLLWVLACPTASAARPPSTSFDSHGVKIAYAVRGQGTPVVLIHGWLSSGWINWDLPGTSDLLAKDHQVITLDMPAHGLSDKPAASEAYGPELVEHVVRLMDHLKIKKAHVVGYSMGGIITAKLLAKHPDRVLSGVLGGMAWLREGSLQQKIFAAAERTASRWAFVSAALPNWLFGARDQVDPCSRAHSLRRSRSSQKGLCRAVESGASGLAGDRDPGRGPYHLHPQAAIQGRNPEMACQAAIGFRLRKSRA